MTTENTGLTPSQKQSLKDVEISSVEAEETSITDTSRVQDIKTSDHTLKTFPKEDNLEKKEFLSHYHNVSETETPEETTATETRAESDWVPCQHCQKNIERDRLDRHVAQECDKVDRPREQASPPTSRKETNNERLEDLETKLQEQQENFEKQLQEQKKDFQDKLQQQNQVLRNKANQSVVVQYSLGVVAVAVLLFAVAKYNTHQQTETLSKNLLELQNHSSTRDRQIEELKAELQQRLNQTDTKSQQLHSKLQQAMNNSQSELIKELKYSLQNHSSTRDRQIEELKYSLQNHSSTRDRQIEELKYSLQQDMNLQLQTATTELQEQLSLKDAQIKELKQLLKEKSDQINRISKRFGILPYEIVFPSFKENKDDLISDTMYTLEGYKFNMVLSIDEDGNKDKTSFLSVRVNSLRGEYDHKLRFPVKLTITLKLLNQYKDQDHFTWNLQCELRRGGEADICAGHSLVPVSDLEWNEDRQTDYTKGDCLKFRVTNVFIPE